MSILEDLYEAAKDFKRTPCVYRPVVTHPDALVSAARGCPDPLCPVCGGQGARA